MHHASIALILKALFDKENIKSFSTWIGVIAGSLNTLAAINTQLDLLPDICMPFINVLLSIFTCIAAFYLIFAGVPAIANKRKKQNGYPEIK